MSKIKAVVGEANEIRKLESGLNLYKVDVSFKASYKGGTPYTPLRRTRKNHNNEIDVLYDHVISIWSLYLYAYTKNQEAYMRNPIIDEFSDSQLREYYMHGEVISSVIGICIAEFQNYLYEVQVGAYNGAIRTLRYILEVTIDCCLFQIDDNTHTINELNKFAINKDYVRSYMNYHNNWVSFIERYKLYEDTRRIAPSFREKINKINTKNIFKEAPILQSKIKDVYSELSSYIHPNIQKITKHIIYNTLPPPNYDKIEFFNAYNTGLEILDIICYLLIKTISHYYGFKNTQECVNNYAECVHIPKSSINNHFNLNYTSKLYQNVTWQTSTINDKNS